jgi:Ca2+-binding RTX toxin-like protein
VDELRFSATSTTAGATLSVYAGDTGLERVIIGTGTGITATTTGTTALNINASGAVNSLQITGNNGANALVGTAFADTIKSGRGVDAITGGGGADTIVYTTLGDGIVGGSTSSRTFEKITDFVVGQDKFDVTNAPASGAFKNLGTITDLSNLGLTTLLNSTNFVAIGAATFTYGSGGDTRTFMAFNDATPGFSAATDAVLEITGYTFASGFTSLDQISIV